MAFDLLPSLRPRAHHAVICVRVCRKWEFRGGTDDGPIVHLDLVLVDEKGNSMYGEIPAAEAEKKGLLLVEGNIYVIKRFRVSNAKSTFRPVPGNYMIEFTCHTLVQPVTDSALVIPQLVYHLLPFSDLAQRTGLYSQFTDVLGVLVEISDPKVVHPSGKQMPTLTRDIVLRDLSYHEIKITLWGQRASAFTLDNVYDSDEAKPIVILLVGTLVKSYQGQNYLSGNAACRWYFNPDIPEANTFYSSLGDQRIDIRHTVPAPNQSKAPAAAQAQPATLSELKDMDPYDIEGNCYRCTVTIARLVPGERWWFASCVKCSRSCIQDGSGYKCRACPSTNSKFKYKLCFLVTDGTTEAKMVCFADVATKIIGKPVQQVMKATRPSEEFPPDIAAVVSLSFTFAVVLTDQSFEKPEKSYRVLSILASHGRNFPIPHSVSTNVAFQPCAQNLPPQNAETTFEPENTEASDEAEIPIAICEQATPPSPTMASQMLQAASHSAAHTATPAVTHSTPSAKHVAGQSSKKILHRDSSPKNTRTIARRKLLLSTDTELQETVAAPSGPKRSKTQKSSAALQIETGASQSKKSITPDDDAKVVNDTSDTEATLPDEHN